MEFVTIGAPFEDCKQFRVGVDESGYHPPCGMADERGPFGSLNEAAAAIFRRQWRLRLRPQLQDGPASADAAPQLFGSEDAGDLPLRVDKDAGAMSIGTPKGPGFLSSESPQHTPLAEPLIDSSSSSQSTNSDSSPLKGPHTGSSLSSESPQHTLLNEPLTGSSSSSESATSDIMPPSKRLRRSSCGSTSLIWERRPKGYGGLFHIRMDRSGRYHTYPDLGGPFQCLHEADDTINSYVCAQQPAAVQDPAKFNRRPEESYMDWLIRTNMSDRSSRRKKSSKSERIQNEYNKKCQFVQVILDNYNDDQNLCGEHMYEVKDVIHTQLIFERHAWYNHFNFTTKIKRYNDSDCCAPNVFFAEVMLLQGEPNWVVNCCSMINPGDNGHCYGCKNDGNVDMKHPADVVAYVGGHWDVCMPFECWDASDSEEEDEEAEWERLRTMFEGLDDSDAMESLFD